MNGLGRLGWWNKVVGGLATTTAVVAVSSSMTMGCAPTPNEPREERALTTAKLMAPLPLFKMKSSSATAGSVGITEWRLYRGRKEILLSGYDPDGKATAGLSIGLQPSVSGTTNHPKTINDDKGEAHRLPVLRTRVHDGTHFAIRHDYATKQTTANGEMKASTSMFLRHALADFNAARSNAGEKRGGAKAQSVAIKTFGSGGVDGGGLVGVAADTLGWFFGGGVAGGSVGDWGGDGWGGDGWGGDGWGGDGWGGSNDADWGNDPFGDGACPSCPAEGGDLWSDPWSGDVGYSDDGGFGPGGVAGGDFGFGF